MVNRGWWKMTDSDSTTPAKLVRQVLSIHSVVSADPTAGWNPAVHGQFEKGSLQNCKGGGNLCFTEKGLLFKTAGINEDWSLHWTHADPSESQFTWEYYLSEREKCLGARQWK
jgi:hypothetical protein